LSAHFSRNTSKSFKLLPVNGLRPFTNLILISTISPKQYKTQLYFLIHYIFHERELAHVH